MRKKYSTERKYEVAKSATEMKDIGKSIEEMAVIFEIPFKTLAKWVLQLKNGELKKPETEKKQESLSIDLSGIEKSLKKLDKKIDQIKIPDFSILIGKISKLTEVLKQTNIRFDHFYKVVAEEKEVKALAKKLCDKG